MLTLILALFIGHAVADWGLQGPFMAIYKSHKKSPATDGLGIPETIWPWVLFPHALINAGAVLVVTGNTWLALIELGLHLLIDYAKNDHRIGFHADQALHYACKLVYALLIWQGFFAFHSWLPIPPIN